MILPLAKQRVKFRAEDHTYSLDGNRLSSVTEVIDGCGFYPGKNFYKPEHAERGEAVHRIIGYDLLGKLDEGSVDESLRGYLESWRLWKATWDMSELIAAEAILVDEVRGVAGRVDIIYKDRAGVRGIIDWKSGSAGPGHVVQVGGGYKMLLDAMDERIERRGSLYIQKDGSIAKYQEYTDEYERRIFGCTAVEAFRACASVYNIRRMVLGS